MSAAQSIDAILATADHARDVGNAKQAAELYALVLRDAPDRSDIWVQFGNMLKDSQQYGAAAEAYSNALAISETSDLHLQIGHLHKLTGNRSEALASYRRARDIDPRNLAAERELADLGSIVDQERRARNPSAAAAMIELSALRRDLRSLSDAIERLASSLPDIIAEGAFPLSMYSDFRKVWSPPMPPSTATVGFVVAVDAEAESLAALFRLIKAYLNQAARDFRVVFAGRDPERRKIVELASAADPRLAWCSLGEETFLKVLPRIISAADKPWSLLPAPGAVPDPNALSWFAYSASAVRTSSLVCDEELADTILGERRYRDPILRNPAGIETLLEHPALGHTVAIKTSTFLDRSPLIPTEDVSSHRAFLLCDLAQDGGTGHVPLPLFWREAPAAEDEFYYHRGVSAALPRLGLSQQVDLSPCSRPKWRPREGVKSIAVVIATRNNSRDVERMIDSLQATCDQPDQLEIVVADNGNAEAEHLDVLSTIACRPRIKVTRVDEPFNWSRINNIASSDVKADILVFANDDMQMLSTGWDRAVRGLLDRREVGAVGAKLLYPDGTIQHAGVMFGWKGSVIHDGLNAEGDEPGPNRRWATTRRVSAVTGAFLAIRREAFVAAGRFDELGLPVAYSDIDLALKLRSSGKVILWTPEISLLHYESKSRGLDRMARWTHARNEDERRIMEERWGRTLAVDPSVHPFWVASASPFQLLSPPDVSRLVSHIHRTGRLEPWLPE